jgi:hypothetical protein
MNVFFPFKSTCRSSMIFICRLNECWIMTAIYFYCNSTSGTFNNFSWRMMQMWFVNWFKVEWIANLLQIFTQIDFILMSFWFLTWRVIYLSLDARKLTKWVGLAKVKIIKWSTKIFNMMREQSEMVQFVTWCLRCY